MPLRRNIDIDLLRTFVSIVETGSFTRTAERLLRTQSAVSLQVKRLEEALGITVFERASKPIRVSADGELLLVHARRVLAANDAMIAHLLEPEVAGVVQVGVSDHFAALHFTALAARFVRAYPKVTVKIICDVDSALVASFLAAEFDLMFRQAPVSATRPPTIVDPDRVWHEPMVWIGQEPLLAGEGGSLPLVVPPPGSTERSIATSALDAANRHWHVSYAGSATQGLQAAVAAGFGIAALPRSAVDTGNGFGQHGATRLLGSESGLPPLPDIEVRMERGVGAGIAALRLGEFVTAALVGNDAP